MLRAMIPNGSLLTHGKAMGAAPFVAANLKARKFFQPSHVMCDGASSSSDTTQTQPKQRPPPQSTGAYPSNSPAGIKVEKVESLDQAWSGVVALDKGENDNPTNWTRVGLLVGGDALALLAFAAVGRAGHGEPLDVVSIIGTAWPFLAGWFPAAVLLGGFGKSAQGSEVIPAAGAAAKTWAVGVPAGILLRTLAKGYLPATPFLLVSMSATFVALVGWRSAFAALGPKDPEGKKGKRADRQAGPFEFLNLLGSMTKRW